VIHTLIVRDVYDTSFFNGAELDTAKAFKLPKRRDEWLLARFAAKRLALQLGIVDDPRACEVARPMLLVRGEPVSWFISVSHSAPYAAAALAREPVGIDVQVVREMKYAAAHLFLSDDETAAAKRCTLEHALLHFWCGKEAAWKRRSDEFDTLRQLPLRLVEERVDGLLFDQAETRLDDDLIVAVTT
jgi:phosphopantetheinyl transferase